MSLSTPEISQANEDAFMPEKSSNEVQSSLLLTDDQQSTQISNKSAMTKKQR